MGLRKRDLALGLALNQNHIPHLKTDTTSKFLCALDAANVGVLSKYRI
jgi:hypothetical protein